MTISASQETPQVTVQLLNATKIYGGTVALRDVSIDLYPGEVHALVGENGAGKSTLTKLLCGAESPDFGELLIDGEVTRLRNPQEGQKAGVTVIYQEPRVFPDLTIADNVFMGHAPRRGRWGMLGLDQRRMLAESEETLANLGAALDGRTLVATLSIAELQLVEIAAALTRSVRLLVVDEPTASLTPTEVDRLSAVIRQLTRTGVAVLFIGHRLDEILALADRITVLRDGKRVSTGPRSEFDEQRLIHEMVGRHVELLAREKAAVGPAESAPVLRAEGLTRNGTFKDVSFELRAGAILALAGLVGSGRTEIARAVLGIDRLDSGRILIDGAVTRVRGMRDAQQRGVVYVPEDRQSQGVATEFRIRENITLPRLASMFPYGWIRRNRERMSAREWISALAIKTDGPDQFVGDLSGGNQQKVVIGKWLAARPRVLILDEPTRGVDVGAKSAIHELIVNFVESGGAVLLISSDLNEVLQLADEVLVLRRGVPAGTLTCPTTAEDVMALAVGSSQERAS